MKKRSVYILSVVLFLLFTGASAFQFIHSWKISKDFSIRFTHMDAEGFFQKFEGIIEFNETQPAKAKFDVKVDVKSVEAGDPMRNKSIAGENWLDGDKHPFITFTGTGAEKKDNQWYTQGTIEVRGVKKEITIPFLYTSQGDSALFTGSFSLNMIDFYLSDDEGESIKIDLKIPVKK